MNITKNNLEKSQIEFAVELSAEEFEPYIAKGAEKLSQDIKIDGFRPGKAPFDIVKQKVGMITILEEAANIAINKTLPEVLAEEKEKTLIGHPEIRLTKLAEGNPLEYKAVLSVLPEVKLGDYKALKLKQEKAEVTEEDISKTMEQLREMRVKEVIAEKEVADTDKVIVDIYMFLDNVPVEGGQGKDAAIVIGKNYVVPGFDKNLIGMKKGEAREFSLPYPEQYHMKNLAGKLVEFKVEVKEVYSREMPEADDEFAKQLNFNNKEDLVDNIKKNIEEDKKRAADQKLEAEMLEQVIKDGRFGDIPEFLIREEAHALLHEMEHDIERQGGKFDDYLSTIKKTHDEFLLDLMPEAVKRIKTILSIREIAKAEGLKVDSKDIDGEIEKLLKQYKGYEKVEERVKDPEYRTHLHTMMLNRKVIESLKEWNLKK